MGAAGVLVWGSPGSAVPGAEGRGPGDGRLGAGAS